MSEQDRPYVAVDCIIFGFDQQDESLKILLIKHELASGENTWSLVSGFLHTDETIDDSATRVLRSLTGISKVYLEQLQAFGSIHQGPEARTIAVAYYALMTVGTPHPKYNADWIKLAEKPKLVFDHDKMVEKAIKRLQRRARTQPIGSNLLPKKFTMRQLLRLYEEILMARLDKRNFIKKINSLDILIRLEEKETSSSRKGSYLFKFNAEKYNEGVKQGLTINIT
jgi:8-oxo-dGTP diphosphatase